MNIGSIAISVYLDDEGDEIVSVDVNGDHFPLITQLGALELARDTLLRPEDGE